MKLSRWLLLTSVFLGLFVFTTPALGKVITVWMETWSDDMHKGIDEAIALFEAAHPDITVDKVLWKNSQLDKLIIAIVTGTAPDLALIHGDSLQALLSHSLNILEPLNEYFAASNLWDYLLPELRQAVTYDRIEYGVPAIALYPLDGLIWNKTLFAEAGLDGLPADRAITWSDFAALNRKLAQRDAAGKLVRTGYFPVEGRNANLDVIETYFDIRAYVDGKPNLASQGFIDALTFLNDEFLIAIGSADVWGLGGPGWYKVGEGLTAMANLGSYGPKELEARNTGYTFGVTWHPTPDGEKRTQFGVWQLVMPRGSQNKEEAWMFAEFMATSYEAMAAINDTTGFFGPSIEFLSQYQFDDPMMQWYIGSIMNADYLRISKLELNLPAAITPFDTAARKVFLQEEAPEIALQKAQEQLEAELLRMK